MHEIPSGEDILSDPSTIPYSEVNKALAPYVGVLRRLLTAPNSSNPETSSKVIPAKKWLEDEGKAFENTLILHVGTLSIAVSRNKKVRIAWLGFLPIAHTLFIAYRTTKNPAFKAYSEPEILQKAWEVQLTSVPSILRRLMSTRNV